MPISLKRPVSDNMHREEKLKLLLHIISMCVIYITLCVVSQVDVGIFHLRVETETQSVLLYPLNL